MLNPAGRVLNRAGRVLNPAGKVVNPAGRVLNPADRVLNPAGRVLNPAGRVLNPAGGSVSPRSGRQHKATGVSPWNGGEVKQSPRSGRERELLIFGLTRGHFGGPAVARYAGFHDLGRPFHGLTPVATCFRPLRGLLELV